MTTFPEKIRTLVEEFVFVWSDKYSQPFKQTKVSFRCQKELESVVLYEYSFLQLNKTFAIFRETDLQKDGLNQMTFRLLLLALLTDFWCILNKYCLLILSVNPHNLAFSLLCKNIL